LNAQLIHIKDDKIEEFKKLLQRKRVQIGNLEAYKCQQCSTFIVFIPSADNEDIDTQMAGHYLETKTQDTRWEKFSLQ
jgi:hypothetical protein